MTASHADDLNHSVPDLEQRLMWIAGGEIEECSLLLRFFGDDLDPDVITAQLGVSPTQSARKGEPVAGRSNPAPARTGMWLLHCERTSDAAENQIMLLFGDLTSEISVWESLAENSKAELKCHLFLKRWNRGTLLLPDTLAAIAARRLTLNLDIYTPKVCFPPEE